MTGPAKRVRQLIFEHTCYPLEKLRDETDLLWDVGVDGQDAWELLAAFCDEFGVDGNSIVVDRHFGPEVGFNPLALLLPSWWAWQLNRIPVTVGTLVEAATTNRWPINYESENK